MVTNEGLCVKFENVPLFSLRYIVLISLIYSLMPLYIMLCIFAICIDQCPTYAVAFNQQLTEKLFTLATLRETEESPTYNMD